MSGRALEAGPLGWAAGGSRPGRIQGGGLKAAGKRGKCSSEKPFRIEKHSLIAGFQRLEAESACPFFIFIFLAALQYLVYKQHLGSVVMGP